MIRYIAFIVMLASLPASAQSAEIRGTIVGVSDGDTVNLLDARMQQHRIRLAQIDAPEKAQPFGQRSKQSLSDLVFGKEVLADCETQDRYGRQVCTIWVGKTNANLEQVRRGMAWGYRQYARDALYFQVESEAKASKKGLWSDPYPTPPWEWRRENK